MRVRACSVGPARDCPHEAVAGYTVPPCGQMAKLFPFFLNLNVIQMWLVGGGGVTRPTDLTIQGDYF